MKKPKTCTEAAELIGQFLNLPNNEWLRGDVLGTQHRAQQNILKALGDIPIPSQVAAIFNMDYMFETVNPPATIPTCIELHRQINKFVETSGVYPTVAYWAGLVIISNILSEFGEVPVPPGVIRHLDDRFLEWLKSNNETQNL